MLSARDDLRFPQIFPATLVPSRHWERAALRATAWKSLLLIQHDQMEDGVLLHQTQAFLHRHFWRYGHEIARHNVRSLHPGRALVLRRNFIGNIAMRDHAYYFSACIHDPH